MPGIAGADPEKGVGGTDSQSARQQFNPSTAVFPTTAAAFSYPPHSSVKGRVLGAHLRGERLTHWDCWRRFSSARLSHHEYVLRGIGWNISMVEETVTTNDAGRPATIGVYFLTPEIIAAAGEEGQRYAAECAKIEAERRAV